MTEGTSRRGRRPVQLLDYLKETRRCWNLKEDSLDRTFWRIRLERVCGPLVGQTTWWCYVQYVQDGVCIYIIANGN